MSQRAVYPHEYRPGHPRSSPSGFVPTHLLVAERALGRPVPVGHPVHHVNEDPTDYRSSNLVICEDQGYHMLLHRRARALAACGHADWIPCGICGRHDAPENLYTWKQARHTGIQGRHRRCHADTQSARDRQVRAARPGFRGPSGARTHCPKGHALADGNLVPSKLKKGHRECLTCSREHKRAHDLVRRRANRQETV